MLLLLLLLRCWASKRRVPSASACLSSAASMSSVVASSGHTSSLSSCATAARSCATPMLVLNMSSHAKPTVPLHVWNSFWSSRVELSTARAWSLSRRAICFRCFSTACDSRKPRSTALHTRSK